MRSIKIIIIFVMVILNAITNPIFATDGVILLSSEAPHKDVLAIAKQQIVLKPGFKASGINANFYAKIGNSNSVTSEIILEEGSSETNQIPKDKEISTPMNVEKTYYPTENLTDVTSINSLNSINVLEYKDGLDRNCMTIIKNATPNGSDIAQVNNYNALNNIQDVWLPTPMDGIETNNPELIIQQAENYYEDSYPFSTNQSNGFTQTSCKPGQIFHNNSKVYTKESINEGLPVLQYSVDSNGDMLLSNSDLNALYQPRSEKFVDEDGKTEYKYYDEYNNLVLDRKPNDNGGYADTYFVYDEFNRLCYTLSPECSKLVNNSGTYTLSSKSNWVSDPLALYAYIYKYDEKGRCISKKMPGKDWENFIYDLKDRMIFSQDGNLKKENKWHYYKYDKFDRIIQDGIVSFETSINAISSSYNDNNYAEEEFVAGIGYNESPQMSSQFKLLHEYFYDNYEFLTTANFSAFTSTLSYDDAESDYGQHYEYLVSGVDLSTKGKLTGTSTAILDSSDYKIVKAIYYDAYDRVIQLRANNHLTGYDYDYYSYNFNGALTAKRHVHYTPYLNAPIVENYTYQHDKFSRVLSENHQINDQPEEILCSYKYDEIGKVKQKLVHNNAYKINYEYNISGQIKTMSSPSFNETLYYTDNNSGQGNYNGSISAITFGSHDDQNYSFTYDSQNRLSSAISGEDGMFTEQIGEYDDNGNIKRLYRYGKVYDNNFNIVNGLIDDLTLDYNGNQLKKVNDAADQDNVIATNDFIDNLDQTQEIEYSYDSNGNLFSDNNKGIAWIRYNVLNLPEKVQFRNNSKNEYVYDADGVKLSAAYNYSTLTTLFPMGDISYENTADADYSLDYCGSYIYTKNGNNELKLSKIITSEGVISTNDYSTDFMSLWNYEYNIKDHQNNTRVTLICDKFYTEEPLAYTATAQTDYYPYGLEHSTEPQSNGYTLNSGTNSYLYSGKEIDRMNGLNMYDFTARWLDSAIPTFTTFDPLAEQRFNESPYIFCGGDPVNRIDPTGLKWWQYLNSSIPDFRCQESCPGSYAEWKDMGDEFILVNFETQTEISGEHYKFDCTQDPVTLPKSLQVVVDKEFGTVRFYEAKTVNYQNRDIPLYRYSEAIKGILGHLSNIPQPEFSPFETEEINPSLKLKDLPFKKEYATQSQNSNQSVGEPGFGESLIPFWGSGRSAVNAFQEGRYWAGIGYSTLTVSDVLLAKALATAVVKGVVKVGVKVATKEAVELAAKDATEVVVKDAAKGSTTALTKFYPVNNGFLGTTERTFLMPGEQISRYGSTSGKFFSPAGTPLPMRALPPGSNTSIINSYKVLKPFEIQAGKIAPAFGQPGLGTQYLSPVSVDVLLKRGIIGY